MTQQLEPRLNGASGDRIVVCTECMIPVAPDQDHCPNDDTHRLGTFLNPWALRTDFPVSSLDIALPYLRRPFTADAVRWKVQSAYGQSAGLIVGYIDARLVIERLNLIVGGNWQPYIEGTPDSLFRCQLTVCGVPREDVGEGKGKAGRSDALKRAAVHFGVGVSIYAIPKLVLDIGEDKGLKKVGQKQNLQLTNGGLKMCREHYEKWLAGTGIPHFGQPIDHGDVEGLAGDEADADPDETGTDLPAVEMPLTDEKADALRTLCRTEHTKIPKSAMPKARFEAELKQASTSHEGLATFLERLQGMVK